MDTSHLDQPSASAPLRTPPYPSVPLRTTRESSSSRPSATPPAPADALRPPLIPHTSQDLAELLRKAGSLSASPEAVQSMIDLGAPADDIVKFTAWLEGKLNGSI